MSPGVANLVGLLRASGRASEAEQFEKDHAAGIRKYAPLKAVVADALVQLTADFRARREPIIADREALQRLIREQSARARELACDTMKLVREAVGLPAS